MRESLKEKQVITVVFWDKKKLVQVCEFTFFKAYFHSPIE